MYYEVISKIIKCKIFIQVFIVFIVFFSNFEKIFLTDFNFVSYENGCNTVGRRSRVPARLPKWRSMYTFYELFLKFLTVLVRVKLLYIWSIVNLINKRIFKYFYFFKHLTVVVGDNWNIIVKKKHVSGLWFRRCTYVITYKL